MSARAWYRGPTRGWHVRIYHHGHRTSEGPFGDEAEARAFADHLNGAHQAADGWQARPGAALPMDAMLRAWLAVHGALRSERTQATDRGRVDHLATFFGARDARTLTETDARRFAAAIMERRSSSVAEGCLSTLRRVLNLAVRDGLLDRNPVPQLAAIMRACAQRGAQEVHRPDAWTRDEVASLLQLAQKHEPHLYPALRFALETGARRGELLALRWEDIDWSRSRVHIRRAVRGPRGGTKAPKSGRGRFTPLTSGVITMLGRQLTEQREARRWRGLDEPEWVFPSPKGRPWAERNFARAWARLRERALARKVRPLPLHATRHTFITWGLEAGVPTKRLSEWVGSSPAVLESNYTHEMPDAKIDLSWLETGIPKGSEGIPTKEPSDASE
jgi:integrase